MRAAILIRRSRDDKTEVQEEVMLASCLTFLEREGYECNPKEDSYVDIGETGGRVLGEIPTDRPAVKRLLARLDRYQAVCFYKFDRSSRDQLSFGILPYTFISHGIKVISPIDGVIDPDSAESKMIFNMKGFVAESERIAIRRRTLDATKHMRDQGKIVGNGRPRYGYQYERIAPGKRAGRRRVLNPDTAPVVLRIFKAIADGESQRGLSRQLMAEGIPSPMGGTWSPWTIKKIITEPSYKGDPFQTGKHLYIDLKVRSKSGKTYGKRTVGNPKPLGEPTTPIVDHALWVKANAVLSGKSTPKPPSRGHEYWMRGRIRCFDCGKAMTCEYRYGHWHATCGGVRSGNCYLRAPLETIEEVAWEALTNAIADPVKLRAMLLVETDDNSLAQLETTLAHLTNQESALKKKVDNLVDLIEEAPSHAARDAYASRLTDRTTELEECRRTAQTIRDRLAALLARKSEADGIVSRVLGESRGLESASIEVKAKVAALLNVRAYVGRLAESTGKFVGAMCFPPMDGIPDWQTTERFVVRAIEGGKGNYARKQAKSKGD